MLSEDPPQIISIRDIDVFDDRVDYLTEEQEDQLLERERSLKYTVPTVPCECSDPFCDNWIDKTDLFYIIGWNNEQIICLECAQDIYDREDKNGKD